LDAKFWLSNGSPIARHAIAKLAHDTLQLHAGTAWKARRSNLLAERPHA
jgi:hypothetical protein